MEDQQNNPAEEPAQAEPAAAEPQDELAVAKAQAEEYLAGWKRAMADYANLKKEAERGQGEIAKYACGNIVTELLPVTDSFAKAMAQRPHFGDGVQVDPAKITLWMDGVGHISDQLAKTLSRAGVTAIDKADVPFNPEIHEAMMNAPADAEHPSGTVTKVLEAGYKLHDRVLRPAKVIVAE
jgi:molecular chaperone GrpE